MLYQTRPGKTKQRDSPSKSSSQDLFQKIAVRFFIFILLAALGLGGGFIRRLRTLDPITDYSITYTLFSLGQLSRETLQLHILLLQVDNPQITDKQITQQFDLLQSRVHVIESGMIANDKLDPELIVDFQDFQNYWQEIKAQKEAILRRTLSPQDLTRLTQKLEAMELIANRLQVENERFSRKNREDFLITRQNILVLIVSLYVIFVVVILGFLLYIIRAINEKRKTLYSLVLSEQRYKKIVETAEEGIWILDKYKKIAFANNKLAQNLDLPPEKLMGLSAFDLCCSPEDREILERHFEQLSVQSSISSDIHLRNQHGKSCWFYLNSTLIDFTDEGDRHILSLLTNIDHRKQMEKALQDANDRLSHQVNFDELTQIANRRYFNFYAMKAWRDAFESQSPLAVAIIDVDYFKKYNDCYGHLQGDICLFQIAQTISASAQRPSDLAARYGGEEFILFLSDTTPLEAIQIIESLQADIDQLKIEHERSEVSGYITLSIGIVTGTPTGEITLEKALAIADAALYDAKRRGRNQYCTLTF